MIKFIAFDSTGQAIAIVPAETAEEATALVLQNPELSDAVKLIPEQETWAYKAQNQPAEQQQGMQQAVQAQQQEDLANEPWFKKIGRNVTSAVLPNAMATANAGRPDENIQEALLYGDVPMYAGLATGNPALAGASAIWGNTVGQTRGQGRELDPTETGLNTLFAGLPVVGGAAAQTVGQGLQKIAPAVAYYAVKPTMKMMGNPNPPNFKKMLDERIFPYFGGLRSSYERLLSKTQPLRDNLKKAIKEGDQEGVTLNIEQIKKSAFDQLENDKQLKLVDKRKIRDAMNQELDAYYDEYANFNPESGTFSTEIPIAEAYPKKQGLQTSAFEKAASSDYGGARADKILSRSLNAEMGVDAPMVRTAAKELSPYEAMLSAMERRLGVPAQNNMGLGLYDYQAMQAAGQLTGGNPLAQLGSLAAKNMLSSTGGAQMLYDAGGMLQRGRPGLSMLSLTTANQSPNIDFLMNKIFGDN